MGKLYRETKKEQGEHTGNQYTMERGNNFPLPKTAEKIGEQFNVSDRTVKDAEKFADAVDTIADTYGEEARGAILSGVAKMTQKEVVDTARTLPATAPKEHTTTPTCPGRNRVAGGPASIHSLLFPRYYPVYVLYSFFLYALYRK